MTELSNETASGYWYFDILSPYAYLQQQHLLRAPLDIELLPVPILFAGLLKAWETKGPAEIPAMRLQTYRYCQWLAGRAGIPFRMPPRHPFNPLRGLRLILALGTTPDVIDRVFRFIFAEGQDIEDADAWRVLTAELNVPDADTRLADPRVKTELIQNTERAIARGVYGVPTVAYGGELFWGNDVTDMLREFIRDPALFQRDPMRRAAEVTVGAERKEAPLT